MNSRLLLRFVSPLVVSLALVPVVSLGAAVASLEQLQKIGESYHVVLVPPHYESTPAEISNAADSAIRDAEVALDRLAKQDPAKVTFESTFADFDRITSRVQDVANRISVLESALPDKAGRDAASDMTVKLSTWMIGLQYREDIYRVIKAYADTHPNLAGEDKLLFDEVLRDYRRAGLALPVDQRAEVERLRKELTRLTTDFDTHVHEAKGPFDFSPEEAEGVTEALLTSPGVKQPDGHYRAMLNITWHTEAVVGHAKREDVRRRAYFIRETLAKDVNVPLMAKIVALRTEIAKRLGYATWADYQTEPRMAKNAATAKKFEEDLIAALQPKYDEELAELKQLKIAETKDPNAKLQPWDINYYLNELKVQRFNVDPEQLRVYFPFQQTLEGMFHVYEHIFRLKFTALQPPETWAPGVLFYGVQDAKTGEPIGLFYLDMYPRDGKYNHFACFNINNGFRRTDGTFECPIVTLLCNFPPPSANKPSLLKHEDVTTLFHEFGHVMHMLLGRAKYPGHSSSNVEQDFVEAPSQMLENWTWDKAVLDSFAADYRDPSKKVPADVIEALKRARMATAGCFYRRQLAFGVLDLALHMQTEPNPNLDVVALTNAELARVSIPPPPGAAMIAMFAHLTDGYDAGYYGYMWSLAIAQDMASVFKQSPQGFLDENIGLRLRKEIYAAAASREAKDSVEHFLGRKQSLEPFLEFVGAKAAK